jgi:hypothetical protein
MFTLYYSKVTNANLVAKDWRDEVVNEIAFPMVDVKKIKLEECFSPNKKDNQFMKTLMHDMVIDALANQDKTFDKDSLIGSDKGGDSLCDLCGENPCVWVSECEVVIAKMRTNMATPSPSSTRLTLRPAAITCSGSKGIRKQLPECVKKGVRALFPDDQYIGFKEQ